MSRVATAFAALIVGLLAANGASASDTSGRNVILVTLDGVRIQELFSGMDASIAADDARSGAEDIEITRKRYWRATPEERRAALMPWFWGTLAPSGMVLGNQARGSKVRYAIRCGSPTPDIPRCSPDSRSPTCFRTTWCAIRTRRYSTMRTAGSA